MPFMGHLGASLARPELPHVPIRTMWQDQLNTRTSGASISLPSQASWNCFMRPLHQIGIQRRFRIRRETRRGGADARHL